MNDVRPVATVLARRRILVRGAVQGVGFRPFVYRQATALGLTGRVGNTGGGLSIEAEGDERRVEALVEAIRHAPPPNAVVTGIEIAACAPRGFRDFAIVASDGPGVSVTQILPDIATCDDCIEELFDPRNRRHLYPLITCTQCGPRYSIVADMPYDRERTAMRGFAFCPACKAEYADPADRRFHAETNACPVCGPKLALWDGTGRAVAHEHDALLAAAAALRQGGIVAMKGIGGFHLLVDARDEAAVRRLRMRKRREEKPFAVMFPSLAATRAACLISPEEERLLTGPPHPIVLLRRMADALPPAVAPGNPCLGVMLPYSPLHHVLMRELAFPVVATSGNLSDEPIVIDEGEAAARLGGIADLFLVHDRPILRPLDDSVARVVMGRELLLRRARGYAPAPLEVTGIAPGILAVGPHMKATVALTRDGGVTLSQHIGDLETTGARAAHARALEDLTRMGGVAPEIVVRDLHPDYASSRLAEASGHRVMTVQHHLAHVAACMAENGTVPPVLGVAWDGTGLGSDGTIWGGEFILVAKDGWRRAAHLRRFRLPGGDAASRAPWRCAVGLLHQAFGEAAFGMTGLAPLATATPSEIAVLRTMLGRGVNAPFTSSMGRLFDAFASLCGLRQHASYEGQAALELEWAAEAGEHARPYDFALTAGRGDELPVLDWQPALEAALADLRAGASAGEMSASLHAGLAEAIVAVAQRVDTARVALTGGCFQNARLLEAAVRRLRGAGFTPLWHRRVPPNDGGVALGQAVWASWCESGEISCV